LSFAISVKLELNDDTLRPAGIEALPADPLADGEFDDELLLLLQAAATIAIAPAQATMVRILGLLM
jgi:hypothetical protein